MMKRFDLEAAKRGDTVYCICFGLPVNFVGMAENGEDVVIELYEGTYTRSMNEVTMTDITNMSDEELVFEDESC